MGSTRLMLTAVASASLALVVGAAPLAGQSQGKGKGNEGKGRGQSRSEQRAQPTNECGRGARDASDRIVRGAQRRDVAPSAPGQRVGRADAKDDRREAKSDARIERRFEREFSGDVDLFRNRPVHPRFARRVTVAELRPALRTTFVSDRLPLRAVVGAVARAQLRGVDDDAFVIAPAGDRVFVRNRDGLVLLDLDDRRVRDMGRWEVVPLSDGVEEGAPSFCRSGAGHPVWGRQWCLDKGFGLAGDRDYRWGRTTRVDDIVFRASPTGSLAGDALLAVLGRVAFDRLALHAITLGLTDPLTGRWMGESSGPRVLLLTSGGRPIAEVVDVNRDEKADVLLVALRNY